MRSMIPKTLNGHLAVKPRNHNLPVARFTTTVNSYQITVEDAGIQHRQSSYPEKEIRFRFEQG